jgi:GTP:adenosylcobinamide-phosphate guanylyltransferase
MFVDVYEWHLYWASRHCSRNYIAMCYMYSSCRKLNQAIANPTAKYVARQKHVRCAKHEDKQRDQWVTDLIRWLNEVAGFSSESYSPWLITMADLARIDYQTVKKVIEKLNGYALRSSASSLVASISVRWQGSRLEQANQIDFISSLSVLQLSCIPPAESWWICDSIELSCFTVPGQFRGGLVHASEQYY